METTEGEGVDFLSELLDLTGWSTIHEERASSELDPGCSTIVPSSLLVNRKPRNLKPTV